MNHCSSSLGHHCCKEKKFVWRTLTNCCYDYCSNCGSHGSLTHGLSVEDDIYSRRIVDCRHCGTVAPGVWSWEAPPVWRVYYENEVAEDARPTWGYAGWYDSEEAAQTVCSEMAPRPGIKRTHPDRWIKIIPQNPPCPPAGPHNSSCDCDR